MRPITGTEVERALKGLKDSASAPDQVNQKMLQSVLSENLDTHMNYWLLCKCPPSTFGDGITTLVPKSRKATQPGNIVL